MNKDIVVENNRKAFVNGFFDNDIMDHIPREVLYWGTRVMSENFTEAKEEGSTDKIFRKLMHTRTVIFIGSDIMKTEKTVGWNYKTGISLCYLHDIGRFPQAQKNNFNDKLSGIDHAEIGVNMIKAQNFRIPNIDLITDAIFWHSKKENGSKSFYGNFIRDADKLGAFEHLKNMEDSESSPLTMCPFSGNEIRQEYLNDFLNSPTTLDINFKTKAEWLLFLCAWFRDLNFEATKQICKKQKYSEVMIRYLSNIEVDSNQLKMIEKRIVNF